MNILDALPNESLRERIDNLSWCASCEFKDISDFIWKAPRLIDHERNLEMSKLARYNSYPVIRRNRWKRESYKLDHTFPYLIAMGNLFSSLSLFETYLLLLAGELQPHTDIQLLHIKGNGVSRIFNYLRRVGIRPEEIPLYDQVQAAIKIRNCLTHASGVLVWSRENDDLRRIQATGAYLSREHRKMREEQGRDFDEVSIGQSKVGEQLVIDNQYCHILCSYLTSYYKELCTLVSFSFARTENNVQSASHAND